ncbi:hypothetical protein V7128_17735 [Neobacillus vireti]|uniref:hypothetical protein n=1 Tax=Neobacillus vireti TaxID=220686 RepID=UPI002FFE079A
MLNVVLGVAGCSQEKEAKIKKQPEKAVEANAKQKEISDSVDTINPQELTSTWVRKDGDRLSEVLILMLNGKEISMNSGQGQVLAEISEIKGYKVIATLTKAFSEQVIGMQMVFELSKDKNTLSITSAVGKEPSENYIRVKKPYEEEGNPPANVETADVAGNWILNNNYISITNQGNEIQVEGAPGDIDSYVYKVTDIIGNHIITTITNLPHNVSAGAEGGAVFTLSDDKNELTIQQKFGDYVGGEMDKLVRTK